jgi:hypothetical protein
MASSNRVGVVVGMACSALLFACGGESDAPAEPRDGSRDSGAEAPAAAPGATGSSWPSPTSSPTSPPTPKNDASVPPVDPKGAFVAVGYGGRRVRSIDDGKTWIDDVSAIPQGADDDLLLRTVVYGNGQFVGLGHRAVKSVDGKTWQPMSAPFGQWIGAATWEGTRFVAVGGYGLRATSVNATTWSDRPIDTVATHAHDALAFGGGRFAATNNDGVRSSSADGMSWSLSTGGAGIPTYAMAYGNGVFVALGNANVVRSVDGGATFGSAVTLAAPCRGLVFAQGHFTALAAGRVFTSVDGVAWTDHASPSARRGLVAYGHGTFVVLGDQGRQRSTDGITWEPPIADTNKNPLESITFGPL